MRQHISGTSFSACNSEKLYRICTASFQRFPNKKTEDIPWNRKTPISRTAVRKTATPQCGKSGLRGVFVTALAVVACGAAIYLHAVYPNEKLEELWFYLTNGAGDSGADTFLKGVAIAGPPCLAVIALLLLLEYDVFHKRRTIRRKSGKTGTEREIQIYPIRHKWAFTAAVLGNR